MSPVVRVRCPLERAFRDVHAMTVHIGVHPRVIQSTGRVLFGLDSDTPFCEGRIDGRLSQRNMSRRATIKRQPVRRVSAAVIRVETAVLSCTGANGFRSTTLSGTPFDAHSWVLSPEARLCGRI
jgi:hypothetical protein